MFVFEAWENEASWSKSFGRIQLKSLGATKIHASTQPYPCGFERLRVERPLGPTQTGMRQEVASIRLGP